MATQTPSTDISVRRLSSVTALGVFLVVAFTAMSWSQEVAGAQNQSNGVKFSHRFHVQEAGLACADCHTAAPTSTLASDTLFAKHENCQACHDDQLQTNCTFCHTSDDPTTYQASQVPQLSLMFSHEFHVQQQKVGCQTCHKGVEKAEIGVSMQLPEMAACNTCHNDVKASNACETCHTDLTALRPADHNRTDFVREHKFEARLSTARCASCHTQESCIDCHNGIDLVNVEVSGKGLVSPHAPRVTANDRGQGMRLTKVHDLNFRFTHGIAAEGKTAECQTCHDQQTFCSTCHAAGGDVNQNKFEPETHRQPGFVTIGVGSGGGSHAALARRDIESCAACHDAQGADPACITCHMDSDGIKGTDPKTHPRGFMASEHGDWHSDPGAVCYTCHTDANARTNGVRGLGFCGYCHK
jgi:hypothetical protein